MVSNPKSKQEQQDLNERLRSLKIDRPEIPARTAASRTPKLLLLAVAVLIAVLAFGYLFGFVGLLVAVPLAATIGVLSRFALRRYLQSSFYTGEETG